MSETGYNVVIRRDESGAWIATVPRIKGCHTYGRTLDGAKRRIREALSLWVDDAGSATLTFDVRIPAAAREAVAPYRAARQRAESAANEEQTRLRTAAHALVAEGFSLRDAGALLNLSHQRIAQLVNEGN